jgi:protein translocase SecG subunit
VSLETLLPLVLGASVYTTIGKAIVMVLFVLTSFALVAVILIQEGKGGGIAGAFGGAAAESFGVKAGSVNRFTLILVGLFCALALIHGGLSSGSESVITPETPRVPSEPSLTPATPREPVLPPPDAPAMTDAPPPLPPAPATPEPGMTPPSEPAAPPAAPPTPPAPAPDLPPPSPEPAPAPPPAPEQPAPGMG